MKKTFLAILACAAMVSPAEDIVDWDVRETTNYTINDTTGSDSVWLTIDDSSVNGISITQSVTDKTNAVYRNIIVEDDAAAENSGISNTATLKIEKGSSLKADLILFSYFTTSNIILGENCQLNLKGTLMYTATGKVTTTNNITLGSGSSIVVGTGLVRKIEGGISGGSLTLNVGLSEAEINEITGASSPTFTRTLITAGTITSESENGAAVIPAITLNAIDALTSEGYKQASSSVITDTSTMENKTYALVQSKDSNTGETTLSLYVRNTPEPATATLSLLALAGLAVRRRRH